MSYVTIILGGLALLSFCSGIFILMISERRRYAMGSKHANKLGDIGENLLTLTLLFLNLTIISGVITFILFLKNR